MQWNSEQLSSIFNWFKNKLVILASNTPLTFDSTIERVKGDMSAKTKILNFLQAADLGIVNFDIEMDKDKLCKAITERKYLNSNV